MRLWICTGCAVDFGPERPAEGICSRCGCPDCDSRAPPVLTCADCGSPMRLRTGSNGPFYGCVGYPACKGTHSAHRGTHLPMGVPANAATREARKAAHRALDTMWRDGTIRRAQAYDWLAGQLRVPVGEAHIANLDAEQCKRVEQAAIKWRRKRRSRRRR